MSERDQDYLGAQQQKLCLKLAYRFINLYSRPEDIVKILAKLMKEDPLLTSDDMTASIFISNVIKPLVQNRGDPDNQDGDPLLVYSLDVLLTK